MEGYATQAQHAGAWTLLWLLIKRHNVIVSLATLSLVTVFTILSVSLIQIRHSEKVAIDALDRIKAEQAAKYQMGLLAAPQVLNETRNAIHDRDYDRARSLAEHVVMLDSGIEEAWWDLGALYMGRQQFDQASAAFSHLRKPDPTPPWLPPMSMVEVIDKYRHRPGGGRINPLDFARSIYHAEHDAWQFREVALGELFKLNNRNPQAVNFDIVEKGLRMLNPDAPDLVFTHEYTPMGLKVAIHGPKVLQILPLAGLPISVLDISHTGAVNLDWVHDAPLISADLSDSDTWNIMELADSATLQDLRMVNWHENAYDRLRSFHHLKHVTVSNAAVTFVQDQLRIVQNPPEVTGE